LSTRSRTWSLPAITVALTSLAYIVRMTRSSTVDVLQMDYVRTANLKGLPPRTVLFTHVLRNSLLPTITVVAIGIGCSSAASSSPRLSSGTPASGACSCSPFSGATWCSSRRRRC